MLPRALICASAAVILRLLLIQGAAGAEVHSRVHRMVCLSRASVWCGLIRPLRFAEALLRLSAKSRGSGLAVVVDADDSFSVALVRCRCDIRVGTVLLDVAADGLAIPFARRTIATRACRHHFDDFAGA